MARKAKRKPENRKKQAPKHTTRRKPNGTFAAGESGNPGGRPPLPKEVRKYLELHADEMTIEALEALRAWAQSGDGKAAVAAAVALLKKTLPDGAVKVQLELSGPEGRPVQTEMVTLDESPESLARTVAILRQAGLLDAGSNEAEADVVHPTESD